MRNSTVSLFYLEGKKKKGGEKMIEEEKKIEDERKIIGVGIEKLDGAGPLKVRRIC